MKKFKTPEKICQHVIEIIGGPSKVARLFNPPIKGQAVSQWTVIPVNRTKEIAIATKGLYLPHEMNQDGTLMSPKEIEDLLDAA